MYDKLGNIRVAPSLERDIFRPLKMLPSSVHSYHAESILIEAPSVSLKLTYWCLWLDINLFGVSWMKR